MKTKHLIFVGLLALTEMTNSQNSSYNANTIPIAGNYNVAFGPSALISNTSGTENSAVGYRALYFNTSGYENTAMGVSALEGNISSAFNTAVGYQSLYGNQTAYHNTAFGNMALFQNNANWNTAVGSMALYFNISGISNSAVGTTALNYITTGKFNAALGASAGQVLQGSSGCNTALGASTFNGINLADSCTAVGFRATMSANGYVNAAALGNLAIVNGSNRMWLGNSVTNLYSAYSVITASDQRFKSSVKTEDVKGLEFIKLLRPVVYNFEAKKLTEFMTKNLPDSVRKEYLKGNFGKATSIRRSGFLAQEVEEASKKSGYDFNGLHAPENENDTYGISYELFVVPLVKGMQEQQKMIEDQAKEIADLKKQMNAQNQTGNATGISQLNSAADGFALDQNIPNPFSSETVINYNLPSQIKTASLIVYDLSGKQLTSFPLEKNTTSITITSEKLAAGIYIYSVMADGKILDSKRMVVADKQ